MEGNYQTATIGTRNRLIARVQTSNQIVRTEAMTLRVWRGGIESVVFGKDGFRQVTAMFSTDVEARSFGKHSNSVDACFCQECGEKFLR